MKFDLTRHAPPGIDLKYMKHTFGWGLAAAVLYSTGFLFHVSGVCRGYFGEYADPRPEDRMPAFLTLLRDGRDYLVIFRILIFCMLAFTIYHYLYHRTESKSIYLMRRLPNRWELHRRCLTLPLAGAGLVLLAQVLLLLLYFLLYEAIVPEERLLPGQFATIWRALL